MSLKYLGWNFNLYCTCCVLGSSAADSYCRPYNDLFVSSQRHVTATLGNGQNRPFLLDQPISDIGSPVGSQGCLPELLPVSMCATQHEHTLSHRSDQAHALGEAREPSSAAGKECQLHLLRKALGPLVIFSTSAAPSGLGTSADVLHALGPLWLDNPV